MEQANEQTKKRYEKSKEDVACRRPVFKYRAWVTCSVPSTVHPPHLSSLNNSSFFSAAILLLLLAGFPFPPPPLHTCTRSRALPTVPPPQSQVLRVRLLWFPRSGKNRYFPLVWVSGCKRRDPPESSPVTFLSHSFTLPLPTFLVGSHAYFWCVSCSGHVLHIIVYP